MAESGEPVSRFRPTDDLATALGDDQHGRLRRGLIHDHRSGDLADHLAIETAPDDDALASGRLGAGGLRLRIGGDGTGGEDQGGEGSEGAHDRKYARRQDRMPGKTPGMISPRASR